MLRRIAATAAATLAFTGLAGCGERVAEPAWTNRFQLSVSKYACTVTDLAAQKRFNVSAWGQTELPDGFKAYRGKRYCEITGPDDVTCHYSTSNTPSNCYKTKPNAPSSGSW